MVTDTDGNTDSKGLCEVNSENACENRIDY